MDYHVEVTQICNYLTTSYQGKKHGGYNIYEDDKIEMSYDTYYPNCEINVKDLEGNKHLVFSYSGHGHVCQYHAGAWENHLKEIYKLVPAAIERKKQEDAIRKNKEYESKFGPAPDKLNEIFYRNKV